MAALLLGVVINIALFGGILLIGGIVLGWIIAATGLVHDLISPSPSALTPGWVWGPAVCLLGAALLFSWVTYLRDGGLPRATPQLAQRQRDKRQRMVRISWLMIQISALWSFLVIAVPHLLVFLYGHSTTKHGTLGTVLRGLGFGEATSAGGRGIGLLSFTVALAGLARTALGKIRTYTADLDTSKKSNVLAKIGRTLRDLIAPYLGVVIAVLAAVMIVTGGAGFGVRQAPWHGNLDTLWVIATALAVIVGLKFIDINHTSLHRYYRAALATAYATDRDDPTGCAASDLKLSDLAGQSSPQLVLCAAAAATEAGQLPPGRNAVSYTFTPNSVGLSIGDTALDEKVDKQRARTSVQEQVRPRFGLFDAVAVSGAAVAPLMGTMTTPTRRVLFAMANIRLGMWLPSATEVERASKPAKHQKLERPRKVIHRLREPDIRRLWAEMAGRMRVTDRWLYVTDGGHYDNLGLVEALRRRPQLVFALDASGDPQGRYSTVGQAIALARTECGVEFDTTPGNAFDPQSVTLDAATRQVSTTTLTGAFRYPDEEAGTYSHRLIYGKLGVSADFPWDVRAYLAAHQTFPTASTLQQLYDSAEFEAYRAMGAATGAKMADMFSRPELRVDPMPTQRCRHASQLRKLLTAAKAQG